MESRVVLGLATLSVLIGCCAAGYEKATTGYPTDYPKNDQYNGDDYEPTMDDLKNGLKEAVHFMVEKQMGKRQLCPTGMVFCLNSHQCVRHNCKEREDYSYNYGPQSVDDVKDALRSSVQDLFQKQNNKRSDICPSGMVFCLLSHQCVRLNCKEREDYSYNYGPQSVDDVKDALRSSVQDLFQKQNSKRSDICPSGMVFCMHSQQCVRLNCKPRDDYNYYYNNNDPTVDDVKDALRSSVQDLFQKQNSKRSDICPSGMVYCTYSQSCVATTCIRSRVSAGECPPPAADLGICTSQSQCLSDSEGCTGSDKCCPNSCGGLLCTPPLTRQPYRVVRYVADLDPDPIQMVGWKGFFDQFDAPETLQFNLATASAGCVWKKVIGEEMQLGHNGKQKTVRVWSAISDGEVLPIDSSIACIPTDLRFHGFAKVNVTDNVQLVHTLAVVMLPAIMAPNIALVFFAELTITLEEDVMVTDLFLPVNLTSPMSLNPVGLSDDDFIGLELGDKGLGYYDDYMDELDAINLHQRALGVHVKLLNVVEQIGTMSVRNADESASGNQEWNAISLHKGAYGSPILKYEPEENFAGEFQLVVFAWSGFMPLGDSDLSEENITFTVKVLNVNDAPRLPEFALNALQFEPRSMWTELHVPTNLDENEGMLVSDAVGSLFEDPDGDPLGFCVIRAESVELGEYQYKPNGTDVWLPVDVVNPSSSYPGGIMTGFIPKRIASMYGLSKFDEVLDQVRDSSLPSYDGEFNHQCRLIKSTSRMRFQPNNGVEFWPYNSATKWDVMAWDETVAGTEGELMDITLPFCESCASATSALSYAIVSGDAMRLDCNNKASPVAKVFDVCDKCGGDGTSCVDCHGDKDGVAIINVCGECVGGNTGIDSETGRDCKGGCTVGEFMVVDRIGEACVSVDTDVDALIQNVYCDGVWRSGAKFDRCGNCTGGTTSLVAGFAEDACGVCHGDNGTCKDCEGVVNGFKVVDDCGECRSPDDADFNTGCFSLSSFEPQYVLPGVGGELVIYGAGLKLYHKVSSCTLSTSTVTIDLTVFSYHFSGIYDMIYVLHEPVAATGSYEVRCIITDENSGADIELAVQGQTLDVILPVVTSLTPNQAQIGNIPSEVVMTGTGFVDTGNSHCFTNCPVRVSSDCKSPDSFAVLDAQVVDSTTVKCIIPPAFRKTFDYGVTLQASFSVSHPAFTDPNVMSLYTMLDFTFIAPAPQLVSAMFVGACKIKVLFDMAISEVESCDDALDAATVAKLGADPLCFVRANSLVVALGTSSSFVAGESIILKADAISQQGSSNNQFASGSIAVESTSVESVKFENLKAPPSIGNCDDFTLKAKFQGAGCSSLVYNWTVRLVGDSSDAYVLQNVIDVASNISSVTTGDVKLTSGHIIPGQAYEFSVSVATHLGEVSLAKTAVVERKVDAQPLMIDLGSDYENWDADDKLVIKARVTKSMCTSFSLSGVQYIWSTPSAEFSLDNFNSVTVKIPGGTLQGGKSYSLSVLAIVTDDPSITAEASVTVFTVSKPLLPKIKGGPTMVIGVGKSFDLDASKSIDPDRSDGVDTFYAWTCEKVLVDDNLVETTQPCEIPDRVSGDSVQYVQFEESWLTADETASVITVPGDTLDSLSTYRFGLIMAKGGRSASEELLVQVKEGTPPEISITPVEGKLQFGDDLLISATVTSPMAFTAVWSSLREEGYEQLDYEAFGENSRYSADSAMSTFPVTLIISAGQLKAGGKYKVQLSVEHKDSSAEATVEVEVNAPPTCASIEVSPLSGTALSQKFNLQVSGCDDDKDDFPLSYRFFRFSGASSVRPFGSAVQFDSELSTVLPKGEFQIQARVCDKHGSCALLQYGYNISVADLELSTDVIDDFLLQIDEQRTLEGDSDVASAIVEQILGDPSASDEMLQAGLDIAKDGAKNALSQANPQDDPEGSLDFLTSAVGKLSVATGIVINGTQQPMVDEGTQDQFMDISTETTLSLVVAGGASDSGSGSKRKRRAAAEDSYINSIDIETAESMMLVQVTALEETAEADIKKDSAVAFFDTLELVWQGVCAGIVSGQSAQVGKTSLLTFRAYTTSFDSVANSSLPVSCENCAEVETPASLTLGSEVVSTYGLWNCTNTETCYGGCLATGQLNYDILTASSDALEPYLSTRLSDIVAVHLINPSTYEYVSVSGSSPLIHFDIELTSTPQVDSYEYMCRGWDEVVNDWSDSPCLAAVIHNSGDAWIATCSCSSTGYFGVFEGQEITVTNVSTTTTTTVSTSSTVSATVTTTTAVNNPAATIMLALSNVSAIAANATTTASSNTTGGTSELTTTNRYLNDVGESDVESVSLGFRINADAALLDSAYDTVAADVMQWVTATMNVAASRIANLRLTSGSIKVEFDLLPDSSGQADLTSAIADLESAVLLGASVTVDGVTYDCIAEPLLIAVNEKSTTAASSTTPAITSVPTTAAMSTTNSATASATSTTAKAGEVEEAEKGLGLGAIIGIAIGGCLLVVVLVAIVTVAMMKKKSGAVKVHNSPRGSEAQMPVVDNYVLEQTTATPEEEAMYGPAPTPHRPESVSYKILGNAVPIGSRPSSRDRKMTPVETFMHE